MMVTEKVMPLVIALCSPKLQESVIRVGGHEVLVGMVTHANDLSFADRQRAIEGACQRVETVENSIFTHDVNPLPARRHDAAHKVTTFSFARREATDNLKTPKENGCPSQMQTRREHGTGPTSRTTLRTCPCAFMMDIVFDRLHTTKCSGFLGSRWMELIAAPCKLERRSSILNCEPRLNSIDPTVQCQLT